MLQIIVCKFILIYNLYYNLFSFQALALQMLLWKIPPIMMVTHLHFWDQKFALFNFWLCIIN
ncbi:hypothetical protein GLOIN_2v298770 [Rhizophagus irregularis DAOM 181602=DAOM 197198]|uniref:Uncharacterized protein n=1 Tax=Rhizophagus irregularis (strain DAOM 181602 / DAOM 197198 / MUCL 43194) TaxID=747089 RepID=A0A2P4PPP1_RHIID|nr:hypothetical protein GLOIN_2v298770 [Rhizophagus irregularis DAOM 181602=DAOM 197198]POG67343.1 hypothetical protein GLOIN_2v298770 [Rhizophagus irregularis DAOM 181602=DAOM 197198]|eukprot:XP_025174209.1 hypothetical protein GLOIN_2v298770 [Rhizophagus irregularis DAOM 181602=DAOM 197198]